MSNDKKDNVVGESMESFAEYMSATTALIEACDWDDEKALLVFEAIVDGLEEIHNFSLYDKNLVKSSADLENLLRLNVTLESGEEVTDNQFRTAVDLIMIRAGFEKSQEEAKKHLN